MDDQVLLAEYRLGLEIEAFLGTEAGKYLEGCCEQDRMEALEALANVDPEDAKSIRNIQMQIKVAERIPSYLREMVIKSQQAEEALRIR